MYIYIYYVVATTRKRGDAGCGMVLLSLTFHYSIKIIPSKLNFKVVTTHSAQNIV